MNSIARPARRAHLAAKRGQVPVSAVARTSVPQGATVTKVCTFVCKWSAYASAGVRLSD